MPLYRITKATYLENYTGLGGSYADGGRWNRAGTPVLYFARSAAVALLEMAHYTSSPKLVPPTYRLGVYEVADDAPFDQLDVSILPDDWSSFPYPASTQLIGDEWLNESEALGLIVPSCAVPLGHGSIVVVRPSYLLSHPNVLRLVETHSELFNQRAFQGV